MVTLPSTPSAGTLCAGLPHAVAGDASDPSLLPLADFLADVRLSLRMDVAFVGRFVDGRRVFALVEEDHPGETLQAGASDPIDATYCGLVARGQLPAVVADTRLCDATDRLPITRALGIGAYLSAPVVLSDGTVWGTVCCFSHGPRPDLGSEAAQVLRSIAVLVAAAVGPDRRLRAPVWRGRPLPRAGG